MEIAARDRRAIQFGLIGLGAILLYLLVVDPLIDRYDALAAEHKAQAAKVAKILRDNKKAKFLAETIKIWEDQTGVQSEPKRYSEQVTAVSDRIMTAGQCGVQIKNSNWIAPRAWPEDPRFEMAQVQIEAEGDWERLCTFLANLYHTDGVLSVEQMDLSAGTRKDGKAGLKLTLSVLVQANPQNKDHWTR
jgi:type II secretory pathway component PulM